LDHGNTGGQKSDRRPRAVNVQNPPEVVVASLLLRMLPMLLLFLGAADAGGGRHVALLLFVLSQFFCQCFSVLF